MINSIGRMQKDFGAKISQKLGESGAKMGNFGIYNLLINQDDIITKKTILGITHNAFHNFLRNM